MSLVQVLTQAINSIPANVSAELAKCLLKNSLSWRRISPTVKQQTGYESALQQSRELLMSRGVDVN